MKELKPCPFCGNDKVKNHQIAVNGYNTGLYHWMCDNCGTERIYKSKEPEAIAAANRRFTGHYDSHGVPILSDSVVRAYLKTENDGFDIGESQWYSIKGNEIVDCYYTKCRVLPPEVKNG